LVFFSMTLRERLHHIHVRTARSILKMLVEIDPNLCLRLPRQGARADVTVGHDCFGEYTDHTLIWHGHLPDAAGCHTAVTARRRIPAFRYDERRALE